MRLTRIVHLLQPDDTEVAGLHALMLLTDARRLARTNARGELIPLAQQDRALWDKQQIAEGVALISATLPKGSVGPYQLQAAIAAVHDEAAGAEDTDWPQILALYDLLRRMSDNPMVALNHAIAAAMVHGATKGLKCWTRSKPTPASPIITGWTLLEHICWSSLETASAPSRTITRPLARPGASRSATTFSRRPRDCRANWSGLTFSKVIRQGLDVKTVTSPGWPQSPDLTDLGRTGLTPSGVTCLEARMVGS